MSTTITKSIEWDMGHRIPAHDSKCRHPHGHRYRCEVSLSGDLMRSPGSPDEGMVLDFGDVKGLLVDEIENRLDHSFLYYRGDEVMAGFFAANPTLAGIAVDFIPTAEEICIWILNILRERVEVQYSGRLTVVSVRLWETPTSSAACTP